MAEEQKGITPKQADLLRTKLRDTAKANAAACKDLCWAVYESDVQMVRVSGKLEYCWKVWGYETWEEYVGQELDLHVTTAYAFKKIWQIFWVDLQGAWDEELLLGITKMRILSAYSGLSKKNVESWLKKAAKMNCRKLRAAVYGEEELRSFSTQVTGYELTRINNILTQGRNTFSKGEKMSRGKLLFSILKEWSDAHKETKLRKVG